MTELEGKFLNIGGLHLPSPGFFYKNFGTEFEKGLVYLYTKKFSPQLLHF